MLVLAESWRSSWQCDRMLANRGFTKLAKKESADKLVDRLPPP